MDVVATPLVCEKCGGQLDESGPLRSGDVVVCPFCGTRYVLHGKDLHRAPESWIFNTTFNNCFNNYTTQHASKNDTHDTRAACATRTSYDTHTTYATSTPIHDVAPMGLSAREKLEQLEEAQQKDDARRNADAHERLSILVARALLVVIALTGTAAMLHPVLEIALALLAVLAAEVAGLFAVLNGALLLEGEPVELAYHETLVPLSSSRVCGMTCDEVIEEFERSGFTNIQFESLRDLGPIRRLLLDEEHRVSSVSIAGKSEFNVGDIVRKSDVVRIQFHSAKEPLLVRLLSA